MSDVRASQFGHEMANVDNIEAQVAGCCAIATCPRVRQSENDNVLSNNKVNGAHGEAGSIAGSSTKPQIVKLAQI
jgi:hypothetical protein